MSFPSGDAPLRDDLDARLRAALAEDLGRGDITSESTIPATARGRARIRAKATGVLAGIDIARRIFHLVDPALALEPLAADGALLTPGTVVLRIEGPLRSILAGERLALNFLQRLSGVATLTRLYVDALPPGSPALKVCDTRKTTPLWRDLERLAVRAGGGTNHRTGLYDMIMLKDTHVDACGGVAPALRRVFEWMAAQPARVPVACEARTLDEARAAAEGGADLVMLDNMDDATLAAAVDLLRGRAEIEVTGGITRERLPILARLGIHRVSAGAITHSAPALDLSLTLELTPPPPQATN